jgi:hypothetical protein
MVFMGVVLLSDLLRWLFVGITAALAALNRAVRAVVVRSG